MKDANEMHRAGINLREYGDQAKPYMPKGNGAAPADTQNNGAPEAFTLTCFADVEAEEIRWLWEGYLALGKMTLLGGDPDLGKSQTTIDAAARMSKGAHWPFGARAKIGTAIFLCSEDDIADTIKPRAEAAGADCSKLYVLKSAIIRDKKPTRFTLMDDLDMLGDAVARVGASLVVIDAITSYMGKVENNSTTDIRAVLDPVSEWAAKCNVAVLGVTHPPKAAQKNAIRQFTGSFAYVAAARLAFYVTKEPETDRTLLLPVKNNIGIKAIGRAYRIAAKEVSKGIVAPYIQWDDAPVDYTADQAIAANNATNRGETSLEKTKDFLKELLRDGPVDAGDGQDAAKEQGISERTLKRAKKELGVKSERDGFGHNGVWKWSL
jgi:putative DNA primase/helicase